MPPNRTLFQTWSSTLFTTLSFLAFFASQRQASADPDFNLIARGVKLTLEDTHFQPVEANQFNDRLLKLYLDALDPDKMFFVANDIAEFRKAYTINAEHPFDIMLVRREGPRAIDAANNIYRVFVDRVEERTNYAQIICDVARFDDDETAPLSRSEANWPRNIFDSQKLWEQKIADEILTEDLIAEKIAAEESEAAAKLAAPAPEVDQNDLSSDRAEIPAPLPQQLPKPESEAVPPPAPTPPPRDDPRTIVKKRHQRFFQAKQQTSPSEIADLFLSAVALSYDPHSDYLSVIDNARFDNELRNELSGIGAQLRKNLDGSTGISAIVVNGPAHRQGQLQPNDRIVAVDPLNDGNIIETSFLPIDQVVNLVLGRADTVVGLILENQKPGDNERRKVTVRRGVVELKAAAASAQLIKIHETNGETYSLGWIRIPTFYLDFEDNDPSVYRDVEALVTGLKSEGAQGIALDLRDNGGGSLREVAPIAGLFLPRGPIVQVLDESGKLEILSSNLIKPIFEGSLIVVTDHHSASASEILAAALQDNNRALVVGATSTYGKGTVQEKVPINHLRRMANPGSAGELITTVKKFYRITGSSTQLLGVIPDIILPSMQEADLIGESYLDYHLHHDVISSADGFQPSNGKSLHLDHVRRLSVARVKANSDFQLIQEQVEELKEIRKQNTVSLNREIRKKQYEAEIAAIAKREAIQKKRERELAVQDNKRLEVYRLNLENPSLPRLERADPLRDEESFLIRAKTTFSDPENTLPPSAGFDPTKRESIEILKDMVAEEKRIQDFNYLLRLLDARVID